MDRRNFFKQSLSTGIAVVGVSTLSAGVASEPYWRMTLKNEQRLALKHEIIEILEDETGFRGLGEGGWQATFEGVQWKGELRQLKSGCIFVSRRILAWIDKINPSRSHIYGFGQHSMENGPGTIYCTSFVI